MEMLVNRGQQIKFWPVCGIEIKPHPSGVYPGQIKHVEYAKQISQDLSAPVRLVNWTNNVDYLKNLLDTANPSNLWIGNYNYQSLEAVKSALGDRVVTIAIRYIKHDYLDILNKWAVWQAGFIWDGDQRYVDIKQLTPTFQDAVDYCLSNGTEHFGFSFPQEQQTKADINITFSDLYNESKLKKILLDLGVSCTSGDWQFYQQFNKAFCGYTMRE
jgi:hypothetical protein